MEESIFKSVIRRFLMVFASIAGVLLAFVLMSALFSAIAGKTDTDPDIQYTFSPEILPNAQNVRKNLSTKAPVILKVNVSGVIGLENLTGEQIAKQLIESREKTLKDDRVKGIILSINSPGGTVTDSDRIYHLLKAYKEQYSVPVYAHVDGMCASGGMYIACAADKIFATNSSLVGSVGVIIPSAMNFSKLLQNHGVESLTLYAGKGKDELNPFRPWKQDEGKDYQSVIDAFYKNFVDIVSSNRPAISKEKLMEEYGAKVYPSAEAKELGYIDESNYSYNQALALLAENLELQADEYQVIELVEHNWLATLFKAQEGSPLITGRIHHTLDLPLEMHPKLTNKYLYLYRSGL